MSKAIVTYDGGDANGIHHTGGVCHHGETLKRHELMGHYFTEVT